jgi:hypothetical protein
MGAAQHDQTVVHVFDRTGCSPGLLDLGGVGGDADQVGLEFLYKLGDWLALHIGVEDDNFVSALLAHGSQVGQPQVGGRPCVESGAGIWD